MLRTLILSLSAVASLLLAGGCGGSAEQLVPVASRTKERAADSSPVASGAADATVVGDPMPPLDKGRLQLSKPANWVAAPRTKEWLVRFQLEVGVTYPSILVTGEDCVGTSNLSKQNAKAFAAETQTALEEELAPEGGSAAPKVTARKVGEGWWVEHSRHARAGNDRLERLFLVTVLEGRKYTLELRTRQGTLEASRPALLAVAGSVRRAEPAAEGPAEAPAATEAVEAPADPAAAAP